MDERDPLAASNRPGANFKAYPQYSWIEDRVASMKDFFPVSTKNYRRRSLYEVDH